MWLEFNYLYTARIFKPSKCLFSATLCSDPSNTIQTDPVLNKNTLAKNFYGLKLSIKFFLGDYLYQWVHRGLARSETTIYQKLAPCQSTNEFGFKVTCQKVFCNGSPYIISSLTLMFPLVQNVTFIVSPTPVNNNRLALIAVMVKGKFFVAIFDGVTWLIGRFLHFKAMASRRI